MIVLKPIPLLERYSRSRIAIEHPGPLSQLRNGFRALAVTSYRGISRDPLSAFPSTDLRVIKEFAASGCDMESNADARRRFCELLGPNSGDSDGDDNDDLLDSADLAREVWSLTDDPSIWEIIQVNRGSTEISDATLGFDVGYWGGDHFSLIADTVVTPCWHPPALEDVAEIATRLSSLNEHLLFTSISSAESFRQYYTSKPWAETEMYEGQFCIVEVCAVETA